VLTDDAVALRLYGFLPAALEFPQRAFHLPPAFHRAASTFLAFEPPDVIEQFPGARIAFKQFGQQVFAFVSHGLPRLYAADPATLQEVQDVPQVVHDASANFYVGERVPFGGSPHRQGSLAFIEKLASFFGCD
jgi:hypothetical protein